MRLEAMNETFTERYIRKSKILYKKSLDNPAKLPHYKDYSSVLKRTKRIAKIKYYQSMCNDFRNNTKKLWDMINNLIKKLPIKLQH